MIKIHFQRCRIWLKHFASPHVSISEKICQTRLPILYPATSFRLIFSQDREKLLDVERAKSESVDAWAVTIPNVVVLPKAAFDLGDRQSQWSITNPSQSFFFFFNYYMNVTSLVHKYRIRVCYSEWNNSRAISCKDESTRTYICEFYLPSHKWISWRFSLFYNVGKWLPVCDM